MSKISKKFLALFLASMMVLGMGMTAMAANESPSGYVVSEQDKVEIFAGYVYSNVSVPVGVGSIAKITDPAMQVKVVDQMWAIDDKYRGNIKTTGKYAYTQNVLAFDVQGVASGQVTLKLQNEGAFDVASCVDHLVAVSHYNTTTGTWEEMSKFAEIDKDGCITIEFSSYSPIVLNILNITASDLAPDSGIQILKTTYNPAAKGKGTSPKTADSMAGVLAVTLILGGSVAGAVVTRRRVVR